MISLSFGKMKNMNFIEPIKLIRESLKKTTNNLTDGSTDLAYTFTLIWVAIQYALA